MSLLIKALEQSARERTSKTVDREQSLAFEEPRQVSDKSTVDPLAGARLELRLEEERNSGGPAPDGDARARTDYGRTPLDSGPLLNSPKETSAGTAQRAARTGTTPARARLRRNPLVMLGTVAVLCAAAFGAYAYMQVTAPGLSARNPAALLPATAAPQLPNVPTAESDAIPSSDSVTPNATAPVAESAAPSFIPTSAILSASRERHDPSPSHVRETITRDRSRDTGADPQPAAGSISRAADSAPIAESTSRRGESTATTVHPRSKSAESPPQPAQSPRDTRTSAPNTAAPVPAGASVAGESREQIAVSPGAGAAHLSPHVARGYALLHSGNLEEAVSLYNRALEAEPLNVDALLGLAYIAALESRTDDAIKTYLRILRFNPRHGTAQAALIGLMGRADPVAAETRLKHLLSREPSGFLHFVLGNLYADQSLWSQAQQAYFQAHHLEPDNPDYAYNVAVGLDHLGQRKLALEFYRRAERLATRWPRANFEPAHARERIASLAAQAMESRQEP